ncbi:MAG: S8 family peptidase [Lachnospiraceae bacterium]|nr:S8 family peptidase [Lachnospiraceae bacterium]
MSCYDAIYGNDYYDFIVRNNEFLPVLGGDECTLDGGFQYTILFVPANQYPPLSVANYTYPAIPKCYVPLSLEALDAAGILQVQQNPALELDGKGVLLGFLDSGIDTTHPAFLDEAGESRVVAVWNQNYMEESRESDGEARGQDIPSVPYGRVYAGAEVAAYGNGDTTGHGTYVASVAAGSARGNYSGGAPGADIAMVQLKEAKPYLKEYYFIPEDTVCYQENDLIMAVKFLNELARSRKQSLVLCMALGTTMGNHSGNSPLGLYLDQVAVLYRRCVVCGTGNMAAARRHFYGNVFARQQDNSPESSLANQPDYQEVEIVVGENTCGFVMEQWAVGSARYQISIVSPAGEVQPAAGIQASGNQDYRFPLENTIVSVDYSQPESISGVQMIYYRFQKPSPGVWRVRIYSNNVIDGVFHMYLAGEELQCGEAFFLSSNPDTTIEDPGNAKRVITVGGYNQRQNGILLESGRGYTIDGQIKPDITAPAFAVDGAIAGTAGRPEALQYEARTGTSASVAITAGAAALYLQWNDRQGNYLISTTQMKSLFIRSANRGTEELYPNRLWGYGTLNLYEAFRLL